MLPLQVILSTHREIILQDDYIRSLDTMSTQSFKLSYQPVYPYSL